MWPGIDLSVPSWRISQSLKCIWSRKEREVNTVPEVQWAKMHRCILCRGHFRATNTKEEWHTAGMSRVYVQQQDLTNAPFIFHLAVGAYLWMDDDPHCSAAQSDCLWLYSLFSSFLIVYSKCWQKNISLPNHNHSLPLIGSTSYHSPCLIK